MMDDEFEMEGMVLVQNDGKTAQELSMELAVKLYAAYEKQITAEGLALKVVEVYINEGYEDESEADIVSLKEV